MGPALSHRIVPAHLHNSTIQLQQPPLALFGPPQCVRLATSPHDSRRSQHSYTSILPPHLLPALDRQLSQHSTAQPCPAQRTTFESRKGAVDS